MQKNLFEITKYIWLNKKATINQISENLNLDKSTVSRYLRKLKQYGVIINEGSLKPGSQGGRKTNVFSFNYNIFKVLGLEVEQNGIEGVLTNFNGDILDRFVIHKKINKSNLKDSILEVLKEKKSSNLYAVGISLPGIIDSLKGEIIFSQALDIENYPLVKELAEFVRLPVLVDNDSNIGAAYYNSKFKGKCKNILYIYTSIPYDIKDPVGIGIGIIIDNRLYHGSNNFSGEYEFKYSLIQNTKKYGGDYYNFLKNYDEKEIFSAVKNFLDKLSKEIGLLGSILDPDTIIYDGNIRFLPEIVLDYLLEETRENIFMRTKRKIDVLKESREEAVNAVGAALNLINKIFEEDEYVDMLFTKLKTL
ncbi:ROK family transcriptional regulator [Petrotoga sp. 9PWA.NaAc.5.4]|uniref:ROK family transcriptional regulator n=1 Tax=Petrotoga sp. 9PWA.NaAc.5.4 TaxID=1434328 RepID=UPI001304D24A|nr:ROK family transcriptional regulator [Petrotoga sp. 9PWA.NaAc.5.4]